MFVSEGKKLLRTFCSKWLSRSYSRVYISLSCLNHLCLFLTRIAPDSSVWIWHLADCDHFTPRNLSGHVVTSVMANVCLVWISLYLCIMINVLFLFSSLMDKHGWISKSVDTTAERDLSLLLHTIFPNPLCLVSAEHSVVNSLAQHTTPPSLLFRAGDGQLPWGSCWPVVLGQRQKSNPAARYSQISILLSRVANKLQFHKTIKGVVVKQMQSCRLGFCLCLANFERRQTMFTHVFWIVNACVSLLKKNTQRIESHHFKQWLHGQASCWLLKYIIGSNNGTNHYRKRQFKAS